jgi:hypothetical protein
LVNVLQTRPLQFSTSDTNVVPATPVKRRGKCMSRRTGQDGHIEASGKWWVVRWWMDLEGQEARRHMRAKLCPISGPGHLSKSERERRAVRNLGASNTSTFWERRLGISIAFESGRECWLVCRLGKGTQEKINFSQVFGSLPDRLSA